MELYVGLDIHSKRSVFVIEMKTGTSWHAERFRRAARVWSDCAMSTRYPQGPPWL